MVFTEVHFPGSRLFPAVQQLFMARTSSLVSGYRLGLCLQKITTLIGHPSKYLVASYTFKDNTGKIMDVVSFRGHTTLMTGGKVSTYVRTYRDSRTKTDTYTYTCN